jgi:hypothetical protein
MDVGDPPGRNGRRRSVHGSVPAHGVAGDSGRDAIGAA